jgi:hypothetical protein
MPWISGVLTEMFQPTSFWAMVTAVFTAVIAVVAYIQLGALVRGSRSDFLYRLKKDFFTEETRRLMFLVDNDLMEFRDEEIPYFQITPGTDGKTAVRLREMGIQDAAISPYLIDDVLLGPLEDLGVLEKLKQVSLEEAYEHFDYYVEASAENRAIRAYLLSSSDGPEDDAYDHFQGLYEKLKAKGPEIRQKKRRNMTKS